MNSKTLVPLCMLLLAGCTSLQSNPEFSSLTIVDIPNPIPQTSDRLGYELYSAGKMANGYLEAAKSLAKEDQLAGASVLGAGVYGAAVTAFNPVPKNLMAAFMGQGLFGAWRTSLKPAERAKIYVQGYRALDCVRSAGSGLLAADYRNDTAQILRQKVVDAITMAATAMEELPKGQIKDDYQAQLDQLVEIDKALGIELAARSDAPFRFNQVRRLIESTVEKRLASAAPDYAGALKLIGDTAKPPNPGSQPAPPPSKEGLTETVINLTDLTVKVNEFKQNMPTRAVDTYNRLSDCAAQAG